MAVVLHIRMTGANLFHQVDFIIVSNMDQQVTFDIQILVRIKLETTSVGFAS